MVGCLNTMRNHVHKDHIALQIEFKNHLSTNMLQLHPPKCNSYGLYKHGDLINKFSC